MVIVGHIILFFLAGFCMYYWRAIGGRTNGFLSVFQPIIFIGGIYFLGWWAVATFLAGMIFGPVLARDQ